MKNSIKFININNNIIRLSTILIISNLKYYTNHNEFYINVTTKKLQHQIYFKLLNNKTYASENIPDVLLNEFNRLINSFLNNDFNDNTFFNMKEINKICEIQK